MVGWVGYCWGHVSLTRIPQDQRMTMKISEAGLEVIMDNEGLRLEAYQDIVGVWTIGFGHTGAEVKPGIIIKLEAAKGLLLSDVETSEKCVNNCVSGVITQGQFDALCSFVFNLGCSALRNSTLLRKLNDGDDVGAAEQFMHWNHAGGKVVAGFDPREKRKKRKVLSLWGDQIYFTGGVGDPRRSRFASVVVSSGTRQPGLADYP